MAQQAKYSEEALMEQEFSKWLIKIRSQCRDYRAWLERTSDSGGYYREWIPQVEALQFAMWKTNASVGLCSDDPKEFAEWDCLQSKEKSEEKPAGANEKHVLATVGMEPGE